MHGMKTLVIFGSPRKNGNTKLLTDLLAENLKGGIKFVDCYSEKISPCVDCRKCREQSGCAINDGMQEIYGYLKSCDNVVIASPVYFSELSGRTLDVCSRFQTYFSEKFFRNKTPELKEKKGAVILTGGGKGKPDKAYETALTVLRLLNVKQTAPLVVSQNTDNVCAWDDKEAVEGVKKAAAFLNSK